MQLGALFLRPMSRTRNPFLDFSKTEDACRQHCLVSLQLRTGSRALCQKGRDGRARNASSEGDGEVCILQAFEESRGVHLLQFRIAASSTRHAKGALLHNKGALSSQHS